MKLRVSSDYVLTVSGCASQIQYFYDYHDHEVLDDREQRGMDSAQAIINRLHDRNMYKYINAAQIPPNLPPEAVDRIIRVRALWNQTEF
jgi:hypothetical protein